MSNAGLADAASALDAMAAGLEPNRAELMSGALALNMLKTTDNKLQLAALGLSVQATSGANMELSDKGRWYAGILAERVRELIGENHA
jgi:hypothetical protein